MPDAGVLCYDEAPGSSSKVDVRQLAELIDDILLAAEAIP